MPPRRVHPLDVDAPMEPTPPHQPKYVMLTDNSANLRPPPQRRNVPRYHSHHDSGGSCCVRCICCCFCFWIILIILLATMAILLYTYLNPKIPKYNVDHFQVHAFDLQKDLSLYTEFVLSLKAVNPNEHIGIVYGTGSSVIVSYSGSTLCQGKLPEYYQPYDNTTVSDILLKGKSEFGSALQQALMENKNTERIPMLVMVRAPIAVVLQEFPLKEVVVYVNCSLVLDNLSPNKQVKILSSTYNYGVGID